MKMSLKKPKNIFTVLTSIFHDIIVCMALERATKYSNVTTLNVRSPKSLINNTISAPSYTLYLNGQCYKYRSEFYLRVGSDRETPPAS